MKELPAPVWALAPLCGNFEHSGSSFQVSLEGPTQWWILVLDSWWGCFLFPFNIIWSTINKSLKMSLRSRPPRDLHLKKKLAPKSSQASQWSETRDPHSHYSHGHRSKIRVDFVTVVYYRHGNSLQLSGPWPADVPMGQQLIRLCWAFDWRQLHMSPHAKS